MHRFFIDRPIFAVVIAVLVTLAGVLSYTRLPVSQFPPVTPPTIQVDCNYPGASADVVAKTIAAPIEQRVNGVERMLYMSSQSTSDGSYTLTVTFETGTDLNVAQVMVQNRVNLAIPELPETVRAIGVTARKRSPEILLTVSINSPDGSYDQLYLSNYAALHLREELVRVRGISEVLIFGQRDYSMRVWVDPDKLEARQLTVVDVLTALRGQNREVAFGHVGGGDTGTDTHLTVSTQGRLETPEQFSEVIVHKGLDGQLVRVKDVAQVTLGARASDIENRFNNKPTVGLAVFLEPNANALECADTIKAKMKGYEKDFPDGIIYEIGYDTTPYIKASINEVWKALRDSTILVAIVVLVFLQSWRAAVIPLATIPVAIVGTLAAMHAVGFGINNLTLFGLVLAVGIVVDDAIVVVEAVQHQLEKGLSPRDATLKAMSEVSGPVVAVGLVLTAVFIPCMFLGGIVGLFFRQFALTIAISTLISTFLSLTLSPALAVVLLKPKGARPDPLTWLMNVLLGWFFWLFNRGFAGGGWVYTKMVGAFIRVPLLLVVVYAGLGVLGYRTYQQIPSGFIPVQDKGYLIASVQLADASSAEQTREAMMQVAAVALDTPGVKHVNAVAGNSFALSAYGSNFGSMFIILDDFDARRTPELYSANVAAELNRRINAAVPKATVNVFPAPAVPGLGRSGGIRLMVQDRGEMGPKLLEGQTQNLIAQAKLQPSPGSAPAAGGGLPGGGPPPSPLPPPMYQNPFTVFKVNSPQLRVIVNDAECVAAGVNPLDVYATMSASLGQRYVNDFNRFGRTFQVNVQSAAGSRDQISDVKRLRVRNKKGELVPVGALADVKTVSGPLVVTRYNMYPAAAINANVNPGVSSGDAIAMFEQLADNPETGLPTNMGYEWTELAFIERRSRSDAAVAFTLAVVVVFLVLAALYESLALPVAVILVVPMCVISALAGVWLARQEFNLFTAVGLVVLVGLASKNAILIVEYAKHQREGGASRRDAILAACKLRLRPILMTSVAFILGVTPLAFADGAGAEMRRALGVTVFAGMIGVTAFGVFLTPVFFVLVDWFTDTWVVKSREVRWLGRAFLFVFAFGWLRAVVRWAKARAVAKRPPNPPMATRVPS